MSSRAEILKNVRNQLVPAVELPPDEGPWTTYEDRVAQFRSVLEFVGGRCVHGTVAECHADLQQQAAWVAAAKTLSLAEGIGESTFDLNEVDDPHLLQDVDFAVLRGQLAVAENAAVWVTEENLRHRVLYFLPQHLALVVPADRLVSNLHEAYRELEAMSGMTLNQMFDRPQFTAWISGPSKTADIEQSLVIGAHGARSMTVYLVNE